MENNFTVVMTIVESKEYRTSYEVDCGFLLRKMLDTIGTIS